MNVWENTVLTEKGSSLLAKLIEGHTLDITRGETGAGFVTSGLLVKQTTVTDPKQSTKFRPITYPEEGKCALAVYLTNDDLDTAYQATQLGIYANDPDEGEILFLISQAPFSNKGTEIPSKTESPGYSAEWTFYIQYGQADEVTIVVDPAGSVSREELEDYIDSEIVAMTIEEIDDAVGFLGDGTAGGEGSDGSGGGVATLDHNLLYNRNLSDQHSIESITGLEDALEAAEGEDLTTLSIETAWESAMADGT